MADVKLNGISKSFGNANILQNIDLDIRDGEFMVFVGPSGCGKSTLLRVIAGLDSTTTALALGKRPGAIRMAQARALGRLRVTLIEAERD